jgi:putative transposase
MGRKRFIPSPDNPYHITNRAHNRFTLGISLDEAWEILCDRLMFTKRAFNLRINAFVMMPNHIHLIAQAPEMNLSEAMHWFMNQTSRDLNRKNDSINQNWGNRFHRSEIKTYHYYMNALKYVYLNPVTARFCERAEQYKYSTLPGILGLSTLRIPVEDEVLKNDPFEALEWINRKADADELDYIRRALKKPIFELPSVNAKMNRLELELL